METMVPKLVAEDIPLLNTLLMDVFPGVKYTAAEMTRLRQEIAKVCGEMYLVYSDGEEQGSAWVEKVKRTRERSGDTASIGIYVCILDRGKRDL